MLKKVSKYAVLPKGHVDLSTLQAAMVIKCATGPFKWSFGVDGPGKCAGMHACVYVCLWYICEQAVFARWVCGVYV